MSVDYSRTFQRFHYTFFRRHAIGSAFTLVKYLQSIGFGDDKLVELASMISRRAYEKYLIFLRRGYKGAFFDFLMNHCMDTIDTISFSEYRSAPNESKRREAFIRWLVKLTHLIEEVEKKEINRSITTQEMMPTENRVIQRSNGRSNLKDDLYDFYVNYSDNNSSIKKSGKKIIDSKYVSNTRSIVVQPGFGKNNANSCCNNKNDCKGLCKCTSGNYNGASSTKKERKKSEVNRLSNSIKNSNTDSTKTNIPDLTLNKDVISVKKDRNNTMMKKMNKFIQMIKNGGVKDIPRDKLEELSRYIMSKIDSSDTQLLDTYKVLLDNLHENNDIVDMTAMLALLKTAINTNLEDIPRRERREIVHFLKRGTPSLLKKLKEDDIELYNVMMKKREEITQKVDEDILKMGDMISSILEKYNNEESTYVIAHNELPTIRILANEGDEVKINKYFSMRKTLGMDNGDYIIRDNTKKKKWSPSLSASLSFKSKSGKTEIFSSIPFRDHTSLFKSWLAELKISCDVVFLAPTDDVLISGEIDKQMRKSTLDQKRDFLNKYRVEDFEGTLKRIQDVLTGKIEWGFEFKIQGRLFTPLFKTNILLDLEHKKALIPIYCL